VIVRKVLKPIRIKLPLFRLLMRHITFSQGNYLSFALLFLNRSKDRTIKYWDGDTYELIL
jgi:hypothetical protein